ncbi:MAG: tRNA (5-methylaminomethyl-2-thiouridine)(34)-methyltransferase MnmD [Bacteroidota bacterium]
MFHEVYGQTYHSRHGALAEARHVFLDATGVARRLAARMETRVLEVGFGTGFNALLTAKMAQIYEAPLVFVSLERELLPTATLAALNHGAVLDAAPLAEALAAWRRSQPEQVTPGRYAVTLAPQAVLDLHVGEATDAVLPASAFDAVYLDAFSPDVNPELWTLVFLRRLLNALLPGGRLATYSAKGSVRRALLSAGFEVERRPGPPGKREMLVGLRPT